MKTLRKGFTLVEMLIVIVIIGILAAALIPRLMGAQGQARDTARIADLNQVGTALAVYQADNDGALPSISGAVQTVLTGLINGSYIKSLPKDPTTTGSAACGTASTNGQYTYAAMTTWYALGADTETTKKGNTSTPMAACTTLTALSLSNSGYAYMYAN